MARRRRLASRRRHLRLGLGDLCLGLGDLLVELLDVDLVLVVLLGKDGELLPCAWICAAIWAAWALALCELVGTGGGADAEHGCRP